MCGIVGYTGTQQAAPILLEGLKKLEYRGYDSAGIAILSGDAITVSKISGKVDKLVEKTEGGRNCPGTSGIGHTRWATHGEPNETNAHPHVSANKTAEESNVVGVHNGIIENQEELKEKLERWLRKESIT